MYILECVCTHRCLYDIKLYGGDGGQSDSQLPSRCGGQISRRLLQDLHVSHPALQQTAPLRTAPTANRTTVAPPRPRLTTQCTAPTHRPHCPIHLPPPCFSGRTAGASWRFLAGRKPISTSREARQRWQCPVTSTTRTAILSPPGTRPRMQRGSCSSTLPNLHLRRRHVHLGHPHRRLVLHLGLQNLRRLHRQPLPLRPLRRPLLRVPRPHLPLHRQVSFTTVHVCFGAFCWLQRGNRTNGSSMLCW